MDKKTKKIIRDILNEAFNKLKLNHVCRSREERPLLNDSHPLWSDGDSVEAFKTTTIAWDIFKRINE